MQEPRAVAENKEKLVIYIAQLWIGYKQSLTIHDTNNANCLVLKEYASVDFDHQAGNCLYYFLLLLFL